MNIYQKLIEVRKVVPYLQKEAKGAQYQYVGSSQVLGSLKAKMDELGLLLTVKVIGHNVLVETQEKADGKKTNTYFTELDLLFTWINAEKPEEVIEIPFYGQGVDIAGEKGVGKALTYAEKYFLLKQFNIATDKDDPDSFQEKAERNRKETATNEQILLIQNKAQEYCTIRNQGTPQEIYKALNINDFKKLSTKDAEAIIKKLDTFVAKAITEVANETK